MSASAHARLREHVRVATAGARAAETFEIAGDRYLAIPQLARDIDGQPADMNGGDSRGAGVLILRRGAGEAEFEQCQRLSSPGCEDAEFFSIADRCFLAVASIRSGAGPYDFAQPQQIYEWIDGRFEPMLSVPGYAAKQWRHIELSGRHFLALAQGVALPGHEDANQPSRIYEWIDGRLELSQEVDSAWGYNWAGFVMEGAHYLAYADHVRPSTLLRWDGDRFSYVQDLVEQHGRAFAHFTVQGTAYLAVACLQSRSELLRYDGHRFVSHQTLPGLGGREFTVIEDGAGLALIRINFIEGTTDAPVTELKSHIYRWRDGGLRLEGIFPTRGGTDATSWVDPELGRLVAVSMSLSADVRFATDSVIYRYGEPSTAGDTPAS